MEGLSVDADMRTRALAYLADIERRIDPDYPLEIRRVIRAYALYVLRLAGQPDAGEAQALVDEAELDDQPLEALAWVLPTLHESTRTRPLADRIERHLGNRVPDRSPALLRAGSHRAGDTLPRAAFHFPRRD